MATLVDLQIVPNRVFQAVKERILANRARLIQRQTQTRGSTNRRPQRTRFGATPTEYKRPEPAATRNGSVALGGALTYQTSTENTSTAEKLIILPPASYIKADKPYYAYEALLATESVLDLQKKEYCIKELPINPWPSYPDLTPLYSNQPDDDPPLPAAANYYLDTGGETIAMLSSPTSGIIGYCSRAQFEAVPGSRTYYIARESQGSGGFQLEDWVSLPLAEDRFIACRIRRQSRYRWRRLQVERWDVSRFVIGSPDQGNYGSGLYKVEVTQTMSTHFDGYLANESKSEFDYGFVISNNKVRPVEIPLALKQRLLAIYPSLSGFAVTGPDYPSAAYQAAMAYKFLMNKTAYLASPAQSDRYYARHFGMGNFAFTDPENPDRNHGVSSLFSPAVYVWLTGDMAINVGTVQTPYKDLRKDYFRAAPNFYLDPFNFVGPNADTGLVGFTRSTPIDEKYLVPRSAFYQIKKLDGAGMRNLLCWDWGQPSYCAQRALGLGFDQADLTP